MARPGFYNDNEYRAYPFIFTTEYTAAGFPNSAVVDCGLIMGLASGFNAAAHSVWLSAVRREAGAIIFEVSTDAPGATSAPLLFSCPEDSADWTTLFSEAANSPAECGSEVVWEGYLVHGPLTALLAMLDENGNELNFAPNQCVAEPSRIQSLVKSYVRSINVGNFPRVRHTPPPDCETSSSAANSDIVINAQCIQGPVRLKEGYNCRIRQTARLNELRITAERGAGDTNTDELCEHGGELPLYSSEPFDPATGFYSGGDSCKQVISTINGAGGTNVNIIGGSGVRVSTSEAEHTLTVELLRNNLVGGCET